jgi:hypothetical protein
MSLKAERRLFRVMVTMPNGAPRIGDGDYMLGASVPTDIARDTNGNVHPVTGGVSVSPDSAQNLPFFLRPVALGGKGGLPLFSILSEQLAASLCFRPDPRRPKKHGFIEPAFIMTLAQYQTDIGSTAPYWRRES